MHPKKIFLSNFSRSSSGESWCLRPETEQQLITFKKTSPMLARGAGLSYSDCNLNEQGLTIDTQRLNHFISLDKHTGVVVCQAGITFLELLSLDKQFIPPVLPGTLHATIAGGVANDIHGKNNHKEGSIGQHILWIEVLIGNQIVHCSREKCPELFYATIGGLGLTGTITRLAIRLRNASRCIKAHHKRYDTLESLLKEMATGGLHYDYQVAWIDLLGKTPRALLTLGNHCTGENDINLTRRYTAPKSPINLIRGWNIRLLNSLFYRFKKDEESLGLTQFNNPLDAVHQWNRLYGPKGLLQFQALIPQESALSTIECLLQLIKQHQATPTLAVLKLFTQQGLGMLSFCRPGFTLAIDFPNTPNAREAIKAMNELIVQTAGRIYLAKDRFLNQEQFEPMFSKQQQFKAILNQYKPNITSNLSKRLGIT